MASPRRRPATQLNPERRRAPLPCRPAITRPPPRFYAELARERPKDAGLLMNLGMAHYMGGQAPLAIAPLQRAAALQPSLAPVELFLGASLWRWDV